jgi:hypothetical protein
MDVEPVPSQRDKNLSSHNHNLQAVTWLIEASFFLIRRVAGPGRGDTTHRFFTNVFSHLADNVCPTPGYAFS